MEIFLFDNPNTRAMIKKLWGYTFVNEGLFDVFDRVSYPGNKFNKKECIFAIDSSAGATWIGSDAPLTEVEAFGSFETIVCDVPQDDTSGVDVISQGPSICLFNKSNPQEVLASWIFAMYLLTNDTQIAYAKTEGYSPVTYKAINNADFQKLSKQSLTYL
ncbi:MAG: ABC transporter substrate-binding protein [Clostridium sp.]|nr:MAG: ABC transporter substrate-binding protein [Clostridium sp.]